MPYSRRFSAFTLVELLVVIAIIGVLAGLLIPVLNSVRTTADRLACGSNLRQIGMGLLTYASNWRGRLPDHNNADCSSWPYIFGDWGTGVRWAGTVNSDFYAGYLPENRRVYYCPTGLRWQNTSTSTMPDIRDSYQTFPLKPPTQWIVNINYCYYGGYSEGGGANNRGGPRRIQAAQAQSTLIGDLMRFGGSAPYTTGITSWNHLGSPKLAAGNVLNERSGGHLFQLDGRVGWIGGVSDLTANRQKMKGNDSKSYCAVQ